MPLRKKKHREGSLDRQVQSPLQRESTYLHNTGFQQHWHSWYCGKLVKHETRYENTKLTTPLSWERVHCQRHIRCSAKSWGHTSQFDQTLWLLLEPLLQQTLGSAHQQQQPWPQLQDSDPWSHSGPFPVIQRWCRQWRSSCIPQLHRGALLPSQFLHHKSKYILTTCLGVLNTWCSTCNKSYPRKIHALQRLRDDMA